VQVTQIQDNGREEWNNFVAQESAFALLQSWEWGEFKEKLGWKVFRIAAQQGNHIVAGAQMLVHTFPFRVASIAYVPHGPVGNWLDPALTAPLLSELHRIARDCHAVFLKIEPPLGNDSGASCALQQHGFRPSHYTNQPRATLVIDLTAPLPDILMRLRKKTRQYIRYAARNGVTVRCGGRQDLEAFYQLLHRTGQRCGFAVRVPDYYRRQWEIFFEKGQAVLLMAFHAHDLLAVRTIFSFGRHAAEFQAGASICYRHLHPDYLLIWEALKWAKARGCETYDLWGIPDEVGQMVSHGQELPVDHGTSGLWGVYQFKRGFSKDVVFHTQAHDYIYAPLLYSLTMNRLLNPGRLDHVTAWLDSLRHANGKVH
jgi:peptidoglycan pentaglycine glycine transferase (the first glycine)